MKKTLIASAIAAAAISTTAFAEDMTKDLSARIDAMPTVYGNIQLAYKHESVEPSGGTETTVNDFFDNGSTLGVKHEHEIAPGITGFLKAEFDFNADQATGGVNGNGTGFKLDEGFIGVKGGFGSVLIGSEDTVYEWVDMIDFTEIGNFQGEIATDSEADQMQYVSPALGPVKVGLSLPLTNETAYSGELAAMLSNDKLDVALAYSMGKEQAELDNGDTIGLAATVKLNTFSIIGQYETKAADSVGGTDDDSTEKDLWALAVKAALGKSQLALGYRFEENGAATATEKDMIFLQALHNLSDNMYVYVEADFGSIDNFVVEDDDGDFVRFENRDYEDFYVGATYVF